MKSRRPNAETRSKIEAWLREHSECKEWTANQMSAWAYRDLQLGYEPSPDTMLLHRGIVYPETKRVRVKKEDKPVTLETLLERIVALERRLANIEQQPKQQQLFNP